MQKMRYNFVFKIFIVLMLVFVFFIGMIGGACLQPDINDGKCFGVVTLWRKASPESISPEGINLHKIEEKFYKKYKEYWPCTFRLCLESLQEEENPLALESFFRIDGEFCLTLPKEEQSNVELIQEKIKKQIEEEIDLEFNNFYERQLNLLTIQGNTV